MGQVTTASRANSQTLVCGWGALLEAETPLDSMGLAAFSHRPNKIAFDRARRLPYTLLFVRDVTNLSGVVPVVLEPLVGRIIFGPGTCKTEWDGRAAGMGRLPRKAE